MGKLQSLFTPPVSGTLPQQLGSLHSLNVMYAQGTNLSGTIPSTVGKMQSLRSLNLNHDLLSGTLPTELALLGGSTYLTNKYTFDLNCASHGAFDQNSPCPT